jgi:hypothetical protein
LPPELVDVADDDLRNRITSRIRAPFESIGKLDVNLDHDGKCEVIKVDDEWLKRERKRIEDEYTFQINNFGRVILYSDRDAFDKAAERFRLIVEKYQVALRDTLGKSQSAFENRIVDEFSSRWEKNLPSHFSRWGIEVTSAKIRAELQRLAQELFANAVSQPFLAVEPTELLVVHGDTFACEEDMQPSVAEPPADGGQLAQARPH